MSAPLVDASSLARLRGLKLRVRSLAEGMMTGLHKSPHQGQSVEFAEHKEYSPGDELRHLDWKAYGKYDKYYIKRFENETNLSVMLVLDGSGSMGYQSGELSKWELAQVLAGTLGLWALRQQNAVGFYLPRKDRPWAVKPSTNPAQYQHALEALEEQRPEGEFHLEGLVEHLAEALPRRSWVVFLSDLLETSPDSLKLLAGLKGRKHNLALLHLLDPAEVHFPFEDPTLFLSLEDEARLDTHPRDIREGYLAELRQFLSDTESACRRWKVDYQRVLADQALDQALVQFASRQRGAQR